MIDINRIVELFNTHVNNKDNYKYYVLVLLGAAVCILIYSYHKKMNSSLKELESKMNNKFEIILYDNIEQIKSSMKDENDKLIKMIENNNDTEVIDSYSNEEQEHSIPLVVESSVTQTETNNNEDDNNDDNNDVFIKSEDIVINENLIANSENSVVSLSFNKLMQYNLSKLRSIAEEMDIELEINNKKKTKKQLAHDIVEQQTK